MNCFAYTSSAVVHCVEFNFSNVIGLDNPALVAAGKHTPELPWTLKPLIPLLAS